MYAQSIRELVFVFPGALGDFLLALPTLRRLRARHAGTAVTAVVSEQLRSLAVLAGVADTTASLDGVGTAWLFGAERPPAWLAGRPFVYSWLGTRDPTLRARLEAVTIGACTLGIERGDVGPHAARAYARAAGVLDDGHALAAGARIAPPGSARADALCGSCPGPLLVIHPGAGAAAKRWAAEGFDALADWWRGRGGSPITIVGPAESDHAGIAGGPVVREWALPEVAAVLARAALYVGNDSGVSHLAAAVGTPGVALFGPTNPRRWRPQGGTIRAIRATTARPAGIPLAALPIARVQAACRRQLTLTRENLETSVRVAFDRMRGCR